MRICSLLLLSVSVSLLCLSSSLTLFSLTLCLCLSYSISLSLSLYHFIDFILACKEILKFFLFVCSLLCLYPYCCLPSPLLFSLTASLTLSLSLSFSLYHYIDFICLFAMQSLLTAYTFIFLSSTLFVCHRLSDVSWGSVYDYVLSGTTLSVLSEPTP